MRKELKQKAKQVIKRNYIVLVLVCILSAVIGTEFSSSLSLNEANQQAEKGSFKEEIITQMLVGKDIDDVTKEANQEITKKKKGATNILGRTRGVFSNLLNQTQSGTLYIKIFKAIKSSLNSNNGAIWVFVLGALLIYFIFWYFIVSAFKAISRRIFLEARIYDKFYKNSTSFFFRTKSYINMCEVLFKTFIYQLLWGFTIIGGIIKNYSYFLVPYIVSENPYINGKDAINLSRRIMNGHKFECFVLNISFIWWDILGVLTFGLTDIFYKNPYKIATQCEYFVKLRKEAIEKKIEGYELFNDNYLYEIADKELLKEVYKDKIEKSENIEYTEDDKSKFKKFLSNTFGITFENLEKREAFESETIRQLNKEELNNILEQKEYPIRLFKESDKIKEKTKKVEKLNYLRKYTLMDLCYIFFILAFIGWLWEVSLHLINNGIFINRGVLHGPWLPIYGFGAVLMLVFLYKFRKKPPIFFILAIIICGILEYFTALSLEMLSGGQKWWDYSGYFINLDGRICAEGLIVFGLGGFAITYLIAPAISNLLRKLNHKVLVIVCIILLSIYNVDSIYSKFYPNTGDGITSTLDNPEEDEND